MKKSNFTFRVFLCLTLIFLNFQKTFAQPASCASTDTKIYALTSIADRFYTITTTGAATAPVQTVNANIVLGDIAFGPDGNLYGVVFGTQNIAMDGYRSDILLISTTAVSTTSTPTEKIETLATSPNPSITNSNNTTNSLYIDSKFNFYYASWSLGCSSCRDNVYWYGPSTSNTQKIWATVSGLPSGSSNYGWAGDFTMKDGKLYGVWATATGASDTYLVEMGIKSDGTFDGNVRHFLISSVSGTEATYMGLTNVNGQLYVGSETANSSAYLFTIPTPTASYVSGTTVITPTPITYTFPTCTTCPANNGEVQIIGLTTINDYLGPLAYAPTPASTTGTIACGSGNIIDLTSSTYQPAASKIYGTGEFVYQWYKDGVLVTDPTAVGAGTYKLVVKGKVISTFGGSTTTDCYSPASVDVVITTQVCGTVFHDPNGGAVNNSTGGTNNPPSGLYVYLVNSSGSVIGNTTVSSTGTYTISNVSAGSNYSVVLTTDANTADGITVSLPAGWVNTNESNVSAGTPDGTTDSKSATFNVTNGTNNTVNFGIQQIPSTDNKTQTIADPTNNTITAGTVTNAVSGSDPEDGTLGNANTIVIKELPTNATMVYNGVAVTAGQVITGFNPALLSYTSISGGSTSVVFKYVFRDAAGAEDPTPNTYAVNWTTALPITLISFHAQTKNCITHLTWSSGIEENASYFVVEHSKDGIKYDAVSTIPCKGSNSSYAAQFNTNHAGKTYVRLKMVDQDGKFSYSKVINVQSSCNAYTVRPSITSNKFIITGFNGNEEVSIYTSGGVKILSQQVKSSQQDFYIGKFAAGIYQVVISKDGEVIFNTEVVKK